MSAPKALANVQSHPAVERVSDERGMGDGCWVYLKPGYRSVVMECGTVHEPSWTKCWHVMRQGIVQVQA